MPSQGAMLLIHIIKMKSIFKMRYYLLKMTITGNNSFVWILKAFL